MELERKSQQNKTDVIQGAEGALMLSPLVDEDYWSYRVRLSETQAVVGFPKYSTIGIGFAVEEDWNTNLPYSADTQKIFKHIAHNKGDDSISDSDVIQAIQMIQVAAAEDRGQQGR